MYLLFCIYYATQKIFIYKYIKHTHSLTIYFIFFIIICLFHNNISYQLARKSL